MCHIVPVHTVSDLPMHLMAEEIVQVQDIYLIALCQLFGIEVAQKDVIAHGLAQVVQFRQQEPTFDFLGYWQGGVPHDECLNGEDAIELAEGGLYVALEGLHTVVLAITGDVPQAGVHDHNIGNRIPL